MSFMDDYDDSDTRLAPGESTSSAPIALEDLSLSRPGFTPSQPCQVRDDRVNPDQALKEPPVRKISYSYSG